MTPHHASDHTLTLCRMAPVIPVLVIRDPAHAAPLARALVAGGLTLLHFVDAAWAAVIGGAALPLSVVVGAYGAWRFTRTRRRLRAIGAS